MPEKNVQSSAFQRMVGAAAGAAAAESLTLPIDIAKVRLQTQTPDKAGNLKYTGMIQAKMKIMQEEGFLALWKGIEPALVRQVCYTSLSLVLYDPIRDAIAGPGVEKNDIPFWKRVLSGGMAGGVSIIVFNPTDVVKTQMQASAGEAKAMGPIIQQIYAKDGLAGFWWGVSPNVARCFIGNACELGCYDQAKTTLQTTFGFGEGVTTHFSASTIAGLASAVCSTPVDVVKTRLMNQAGANLDSKLPVYTGTINALVNIPRNEGILALYKGFLPLFYRKVLWTVSFFLIYEQIKKVI